jgi:hypothetical protein
MNGEHATEKNTLPYLKIQETDRVVLLLDISSIAGFENYQKSGEMYER